MEKTLIRWVNKAGLEEGEVELDIQLVMRLWIPVGGGATLHPRLSHSPALV